MVKKNIKKIKKYITFSLDDGNKYDIKLLELFEKYGLKATFYIPKEDKWFRRKNLNDKEIKKIAQTQEIGAHSLTHASLKDISFKQQQEEIFESKKYLEKLLRQKISMFCYPYGIYNNIIIDLVRKSGYIGARTTDSCFFEVGDPFKMKVSLHIYPYPFLKKPEEYSNLFWLRKILLPLKEFEGVVDKYNLGYNSYFSWLALAKNMLEYFFTKGEVFHIWGHSWEIEKFNMWQELEEFFKILPKGDEISYLTNSEVIKEIKK